MRAGAPWAANSNSQAHPPVAQMAATLDPGILPGLEELGGGCLWRASGAPGHGPVEQPAGEAPSQARSRHIVQTVLLAVQDGFGRLETAAHGGTYPLRHVARREARGIADDEGVAPARHIHLAPEIVAVAGGVVMGALGEPAAEHAGEERPVIVNGALARLDAVRHAADADVEPAVLLRDVPGVSGQPMAEEPEMAVGLAPVVLDLVLQGDRLKLTGARVELPEERAVHRATSPARPDQIPRAERVVDDVGAFRLADV